jgi:hypothetical protein
MSETIKCKNCNKDSNYIDSECLRISDVYDKTDFKFIMTVDGGSLFLCDECYIKVKALAEQIYSIVKDEDIMLFNLLYADK